MHALELKIPPPAVAALFAAAMWSAADIAPSLAFPLPGQTGIAVVLAVAGVLISLSGVLAFRRAKTTVNPMKPQATSSIVTRGIYQHTRNPMYLGFLLALAGWGAYLSNALALGLAALFVAYMNRFQIVPEERVLLAKFGAEFADYMKSVRRWL